MTDAVAVIGMSGRFPGAANPEAYWENLAAGRECLTRFEATDLTAAGVPPAEARNADYVPVRGTLDAIEYFDADFFGMPPREAAVTDPQHRLLLECAWEAAENAGYPPDALPGHAGVYVGTGVNSYLAHHVQADPELLAALGPAPVVIGNEKDHAATRIAYRLGLRGPAVAVQSACSTSLVAVHMASRALLGDECDMALAGGACVTVPQHSGYLHTPHDITSPDGHCRAFDRDARGTVAGNGAGLVLLKRLSDALADNDRVLAVIRGSAVNNDGPGRAGYTAPRVEGQADVLLRAYAAAGISPDTVDYVEAHGTGTEIGDSVEVLALTEAFRRHTDRTGYCGIGSVKPNIGHLDAAAGVASLIKAVLAMHHQAMPPTINYTRPNPEIPLHGSPFYINDHLQPWPPSGDRARRMGVSSFGMGGTNAHVVLEEAPRPAARTTAPPRPDLVLLSARTPQALNELTQRLAQHLDEHPELALADIAHTTRVGRSAFRHRRAVVCSTSDTFRSAISPAVPETPAAPRPAVAFLFPGQGTQYPGMATALYDRYTPFREALDTCAEATRDPLGVDLRQVLSGQNSTPSIPDTELDQTWLAQPALFAVSYALGALLLSWGLRPSVLLGHSLGEYAAACHAGALEPAAAARLVAVRGQLVQQTKPGTMLAVQAAPHEIEAAVRTCGLDIAAVNGPRSLTVSGPAEAVTAFEEHCAGVLRTHRLPGTRAFHSRLLDPAVEEFRAAAAHVQHRPLAIPLISNVTGQRLPRGTVLDADYWARHLREPVRFHNGLRALAGRTRTVALEVGPGHTLAALVRQTLSTEAVSPATTLPGRDEPADAVAALLAGVGAAWEGGAPVDWDAFADGADLPHRIPLPTYPFQRTRHWIDRPGTAEPRTPTAPAPQDPLRHTTQLAEAEKKIIGLWQDLLGAVPLSSESDFFAAGGESLLAVRLLGRIRREFGVRLTIRDLVREPTVRAMARTLLDARPAGDGG